MIRDEKYAAFVLGLFVATLINAMFANKMHSNENDILRVCLTHSIPLEHCKIPEEGK